MKWPRPHRRCAATIVGVVIAVGLCGCHNQQTALSNPFMAPDRVPPPGTRAVAPGTAQPYYPGDPIPAPHASISPGAPTIAAASSPAPNAASTPSAGSSTAAPTTRPPTSLAFSNERTVSVPADDSSLRFSLPAPQPVANVATSPQPVTAPALPPTAPSAQLVAQSNPSPVIPASYTSPDPYRVAPTGATDSISNGPWRPPQIPASSTAASPWINSAPTLAATSPQPVAPAAGPTIPVTLRAVPSPAVDTTVSLPPRIRFPSYDATPQVMAAPTGGPVQQAAFVPPGMSQPIVVPQASQPQTVAITPLPTYGTVPGLGPAVMPSVNVASQPQTAGVVSPDGFRPRSTLR